MEGGRGNERRDLDDQNEGVVARATKLQLETWRCSAEIGGFFFRANKFSPLNIPISGYN